MVESDIDDDDDDDDRPTIDGAATANANPTENGVPVERECGGPWPSVVRRAAGGGRRRQQKQHSTAALLSLAHTVLSQEQRHTHTLNALGRKTAQSYCS